MHRVVAGLLSCALLALWAPALPRHVHDGADHAHAEHRHGIATHTHDHERSRVADQSDHAASPARPHLKACTPEAHTLDAALTSAAVARHGSSPAGDAVTALRLPRPAATHAAQPFRADVRVHGPPSVARTSPRAPPRLLPA